MFIVKKEVAEPTEKVKVSLPVSTIAWAKALGEPAGKSVEDTLQEAIAYARESNETGAISISIPDSVRQFAEAGALAAGTKFEDVLVDVLRSAASKAARKAASTK